MLFYEIQVPPTSTSVSVQLMITVSVCVVWLFAGWVTDLVSPLGEHVTLLGSGSTGQDRTG